MENPGGIRIGKKQMLKGGISDPRNKALMKMLNLIGIGERAGSGVPDIYGVWAQQGWQEPSVREEYDPDRTILQLTFLPIAAIKSGDKKAAIKNGDKEENEKNWSFGVGKVELFTDYQAYSKYDFDLDYTEDYFDLNNLLVFVVHCCSSDQMEFGEILQAEGKLYPMFYRAELKDGEPVTDDYIVLSFCVEISKSDEYGCGEIIYKYR